MPSDVTPLPGGTPLALEEIQGDVLLGLQKFFEQFLFFEIKDVGAFKTALRGPIATKITTTKEVQDREQQLSVRHAQENTEVMPLPGLNLGFSNSGLQKLIPTADLGDPSFAAGARARAADPNTLQLPGLPPTLPINDPVDGQGNLTTWIQPFLSGNIDGVFLITDGTRAAVEDAAARIIGVLGTSADVLFRETGSTRPGTEHGHEHFGWLDGISQPGINGLLPRLPGQDILDPGLFVFGYPGGTPASLPWMRNGSFMVFRRLLQLVPEFNQFLSDKAMELGIDPVLLGARMVGRWKSGAPLSLAPSTDNSTLGNDPQQNNNFDFADDQAQRRCPFGAHIRKTNPRLDVDKAGLDPHRILRSGIPFGQEVTAAESEAKKTQQERGLHFVCYQTSIPQQFEFVQGTWANNPGFVFNKTRPSDGTEVTVGFDPIIGQAKPPIVARMMDEPIPKFPAGDVRSTLNLAQAFIVPTAGGYFFMPSISAIRNELSA